MPRARRTGRKPPYKIKRKPDADTNGQTRLDTWLASGNNPVPPKVEKPIELGVEYETEDATVLLKKQQVERNSVLQAQKLICDAIEKSKDEQDKAIRLAIRELYPYYR